MRVNPSIYVAIKQWFFHEKNPFDLCINYCILPVDAAVMATGKRAYALVRAVSPVRGNACKQYRAGWILHGTGVVRNKYAC